MLNSTLIHYGEIALKGKNRSYFEKALIENIQKAVGSTLEIKRDFGRLYLPKPLPPEKLQALSQVFGVSWVTSAIRIPPQLNDIQSRSLNIARKYTKSNSASFAIRATRADKNFPLNSKEIEQQIGAAIQENMQLPVNLRNPDLTIYVEITSQNAFIYTQKHAGPGGLPAGTSGKVIVLFSGGLDSAVTTFLMGQRGCRVHLLHFHAFPSNAQAKKSKITQMAAHLSRYFPGIDLTLVPYTDYYFHTLDLPKNLTGQELIVFRRFITLCANKLAQNKKYDAIVTGDSLGQVASQTMSNLKAVNTALQQTPGKPIFRPLIGLNKNIISELGEKIEISTLANKEYKDCCSIVARHPSTKANLRKIEEIERLININETVNLSLSASETIELKPTNANLT